MMYAPSCGAVHQTADGQYAICDKEANGHDAHYDELLRISWNDKQEVELTKIVTHKRIQENVTATPRPLCGDQNWHSLISVDADVNCKKCLKLLTKKIEERKGE